MGSQQLAGHIAAALRKTWFECNTIPEMEVFEFTPSIRAGIAYLGIKTADGKEFAIEIEDLGRTLAETDPGLEGMAGESARAKQKAACEHHATCLCDTFGTPCRKDMLS